MWEKIKSYKKHVNFEILKTASLVVIFIVAYMLIRISVRPQNGFDVLVNDFLAALFLASGFLMLYIYKSFRHYLKKYDLVARKFDIYSKVYPILFIVFGLLLHVNKLQRVVGVVTVVVLSVQTFGMIKSVEKLDIVRHIRISSKRKVPAFWLIVGVNIIIITLAVILSIIFGF